MNETGTQIKLRRGALITALPLSIASFFFIGGQAVSGKERLSASAGYVEGTSASCVTVLGETPVGIKSVHVSFNVPSCGVGAYEEDAPSFTATYTLYNPTERDETVRLAFPYELVGGGYGQNDAQEWNKETNCRICLDNGDLDYDLHYTYKARNGADAFSGLGKLQNVAASDGFYSEELPVTKYTYRITMSGQSSKKSFVKLFLKRGKEQTKIMRRKDCTSAGVENGYRFLGYDVTDGSCDVTYYAIGGESEVVCWKGEEGEEVSAVELLDKNTVTFAQFVEAFRPEDFTSKEDWYRAAIDFFNDTEYKELLPSLLYGSSCSFIRWYLYDVNVPAGGTKEHSVSAPLYPANSTDGKRFSCQLSPLSAFSSFGDITVEVNTPYYMAYSSLDFTKDGSVYSFSREELPYGELSFVLSETGEPPARFGLSGVDSVILAIVILAVLVTGATIATVVLVVKNKRARETSAYKETRARMGRPEEGKIDDTSNHVK